MLGENNVMLKFPHDAFMAQWCNVKDVAHGMWHSALMLIPQRHHILYFNQLCVGMCPRNNMWSIPAQWLSSFLQNFVKNSAKLKQSGVDHHRAAPNQFLLEFAYLLTRQPSFQSEEILACVIKIIFCVSWSDRSSSLIISLTMITVEDVMLMCHNVLRKAKHSSRCLMI